MKFEHISVLKEPVLENLIIKDNAVIVDLTLGGGGHTKAILERNPTIKVIAVDKDSDALDFCKEYLKEYGDRITFVKSDFVNAEYILGEAKLQKVDGVLMDLGVSSFQLDNFSRGFSYRADEELLDMRMDKEQYLTAFNVVNEYDYNDLLKIFFEYGEEKFSKRIAENIIAYREKQSIRTCGQLNEIIDSSIPFKFKQHGHPSKKIFQAIRIEVNKEIENLRIAVEKWVRALNTDGRICVITFHSLEDRIIKNTFRELEKSCICDKRAPICVCNKVSEVEVLTKNIILPSEEEMKANPRSKSAKLRVARKK